MARYRVTDYGAVSDGNTATNRVAFQTILNLLQPGDEIYIPNGRFRISEPTLNTPWCLLVNGRSGWTWLHESENATVEQTPEEANNDVPFGNHMALVQVRNCENFTFQDFYMEGNKTGAGGPTDYEEPPEHHRAIFVEDSERGRFHRGRIQNFTGDAIQLYNNCYDMDFWRIRARWNQRDGITFSPSSYLTPVRKIRVRQCELWENSNQQIDNEHGPAHDVEVWDTSLRFAVNNTSLGLVMAGSGSEGAYPSTDWYFHHNTVLGAIRMTWVSNWRIEYNDITNPRLVSAIELERMQSNGRIRNNVIRHQQPADPQNLSAIYINGTVGGGPKDILIEENDISVAYARAYGIRADGAVSLSIIRNRLVGAGIAGAGFAGIRVRATVFDRPVESVVVRRNQITGFGQYGMRIQGNTFQGATAKVNFFEATGNTMTAGGSMTSGISLGDANNPLLSHKVADNTYSGIADNVKLTDIPAAAVPVQQSKVTMKSNGKNWTTFFRNAGGFISKLFLVLLLCLPARAFAEPLYIQSASTCKTDGGSDLRLPPGYFLDVDLWKKLDLEVRRLQEAETRLKGEKTELEKTPGTTSTVVVTGALILGFVVGASLF
jgi:hypothetical protein